MPRSTSAAPGEKRRIKSGQIGAHHAHAGGQMETMCKLDDIYEVVGVIEPDEARRRQVAHDRTYRDLPFLSEDQLPNTEGLEVVAIERTSAICYSRPKGALMPANIFTGQTSRRILRRPQTLASDANRGTTPSAGPLPRCLEGARSRDPRFVRGANDDCGRRETLTTIRYMAPILAIKSAVRVL